MGDKVRLVDKSGNAIEATRDEAAQLLTQGDDYRVETGTDVADRAVREADKEVYGGAAGGIVSTGAALARGFTGGGSDVAIGLLGGKRALQKLKEQNPTLSTAGELTGAVLPGGIASVAGRAGRAAGALGEGAGLLGQVGSAAARFGTEGAVYGAGTAVSELALSDHPLTAEHIASTLGSNMLLGAGIGGVTGGALKLGEKALARAGTAITEAAAARKALEGVPADIASLDEAGLRNAATAAKAEHVADIAAERKSLESLRVEQRAELANQVRDFHAELATERPIFQAVAGEDIRKVANIGTEVASPLNKSYKALRSAFDNPIAVAENPTKLLQPLQMQQTALENLQAKIPDLHASFPGDARLASLEHVDIALEQNKAFQAQIRALDKSAPVSGTRLSMLEAGPSAKMQSIEAAKEALKNAPELGLIGKGVKGGTFAGVTALAHMIPGVGIAAPFLGKAASEWVGTALERLAGSAKAVSAKTSAMTKAFLDTAQKVEPMARTTATKVLSSVRFGAEQAPKSEKLADLYHARSAELRQQTMYAPDGSVQMRPEARMALADKLKPIAAVNPLLADKIETVTARKVAFMSSKLPRRPDVGGLQVGPDNWKPSDLEIRSWARTVRACEDPASVEEQLLHGHMTPEAAEAYRMVFPERFAALKQAVFEAAPMLSKTLPMKRKVALSIFTGVPCTPLMQPNVLAVLQGNFAREPGSAGGTQAPTPQPNFGPLGSLKSPDKPTKSQAREMQP